MSTVLPDPWSFGWEALAALSTIALASVTVWLAFSTRRLAREASAETRANWQPVLTIEPIVTEGGSSPAVSFAKGTLAIGVRNVGRGPALIVRGSLFPLTLNPIGGRIQSDVLAPGDWRVITWRDLNPPREPGRLAWVDVDGTISYGDIAYARSETRFTVSFSLSDDVALTDQQFVSKAVLRGGFITRLIRRLLSVWWGSRLSIAWDRLAPKLRNTEGGTRP